MLAIHYLTRNKESFKEPVYTDEDTARAKADMDAMYLREHGNLPEPPEDDTAARAEPEKDTASLHRGERLFSNKKNITFRSFMMHPKIQQGLCAIVLCLALPVTIDMGLFFLLIPILLLFGIIRFGQGCMEIL